MSRSQRPERGDLWSFAPSALNELVSVGTLTKTLAAELVAAVRCRRNILISGGTGTGKTTLLNALAATIPADHRIVLIEETSEY